jgi:hypothetical protein
MTRLAAPAAAHYGVGALGNEGVPAFDAGSRLVRHAASQLVALIPYRKLE